MVCASDINISCHNSWVKKFPNKVKINPETETYIVGSEIANIDINISRQNSRVKKFPEKLKIKPETYLVVKFRILTL